MDTEQNKQHVSDELQNIDSKINQLQSKANQGDTSDKAQHESQIAELMQRKNDLLQKFGGIKQEGEDVWNKAQSELKGTEDKSQNFLGDIESKF